MSTRWPIQSYVKKLVQFIVKILRRYYLWKYAKRVWESVLVNFHLKLQKIAVLRLLRSQTCHCGRKGRRDYVPNPKWRFTTRWITENYSRSGFKRHLVASSDSSPPPRSNYVIFSSFVVDDSFKQILLVDQMSTNVFGG